MLEVLCPSAAFINVGNNGAAKVAAAKERASRLEKPPVPMVGHLPSRVVQSYSLLGFESGAHG